MPAVSVRRMDEPSDTSDARGLQARSASASLRERPPSGPTTTAMRAFSGSARSSRRPRSSAFSMRASSGASSQHTSTAVACAKKAHTSASAIGSPTSGHARWPDCMAALFAMARHRCVLAAAFFASSLTMERSHDIGTNAETPSSVACRITVSILSPLARPCTSITRGRSSSSRRCAMRTTGTASSKAVISHSK